MRPAAWGGFGGAQIGPILGKGQKTQKHRQKRAVFYGRKRAVVGSIVMVAVDPGAGRMHHEGARAF